MALGTIGTALATSAIQAGVGIGASKLFGGKSKGGLSSFAPTGFSGGGLSSSFDRRGQSFSVSASPERQGVVGNLAGLFPQQANLVAGLRGQVAPGVGALTQSRLSELDNRARESIGNLRDNLQRRRVLGSSFGQDAVQRAEIGVAQEADRIRSESFLQELDLTNQLIQQEFGLRRQEFQTQLDDMNLQAELASKLSQGASAQLASNAQLKERLNAESAAGAGRFFGQALQPAIDAIGSGLGQFGTLSQIGRNLASSTAVSG